MYWEVKLLIKYFQTRAVLKNTIITKLNTFEIYREKAKDDKSVLENSLLPKIAKLIEKDFNLKQLKDSGFSKNRIIHRRDAMPCVSTLL